MAYNIVFYKKANGEEPAQDYINTLSKKMQARVARILDILRERGPKLGMPQSEYLDDGICQIRAQQEGNISRVLYFFAIGKNIILTNGFTKKTPKTPKSEIEKAKEYRNDYYKHKKGSVQQDA